MAKIVPAQAPYFIHCISYETLVGHCRLPQGDIATRSAAVELWPAPGSEDTELGVILEPEVVYGTQTLCTRVQA